MTRDPDDSRRQGQEQDLPPGTVFLRRDYRALDEHWEHDHCEMCWAKLMDPQSSADHAQFIVENRNVLTEGFVTKVEERRLERWVCEPCFEDFATEFGWAQRCMTCVRSSAMPVVSCGVARAAGAPDLLVGGRVSRQAVARRPETPPSAPASRSSVR